MGKKIKLVIHYGGSMRKEDDTYVYDSELGCQFVEWELANIKWDTFSDFCFSLKISAPIIFIYFKDALEDMSKVQYAYESINMVDLHAMLCIAEVDGTMEIFLEHEVSESTPIVHYLVSSQHEDRVEKESGDRNDNDNNRFEDDDDNEADDEGGSESEEEDEKEDGGEDGDDRPREDVDPKPSEDECPVEENETQAQDKAQDKAHDKAHGKSKDKVEDIDDGDDVVAEERVGTYERFKEVFREGESLKKPVEDKDERERLRKEAEESDEDYEGYMKGDAIYPDTPASSEEEWEDWVDKRRFKGKGPSRFHGDLSKEPFIWLFRTFNSGLEFKDQLLRYSLNTQYDVKMAKSEKDIIACVCCNKECKWRVFVSDKQKGLVVAMEKELPGAEHRMCARYIYANWRKSFSRSEYKNLFWGVAYSYNKGEFARKMTEVEDYDPAAHYALEQLEPEKWCRAWFDTTSHCHDVHNNLSEAFNRPIKIARAKLVLSMLEDIRRQAMRRISRRYFKAQKLDTLLTPITMAILEKARIGNAYCSTIRSSENLYEVVEFDRGYTVRMLTHECACRRWDLTGIPCKHAICVMDDNQEDAEQYVVNYYHCAVMRSTYNDNIKPVNGKELWTAVNKPPIGVPEFRKPRGRPKKRNRKKEPFEDLENAGKSTRHRRVQHCSNCGEAEHTSRSCKNESVVVEGPKNRRGRPKKFPEKQPVRPKRPTKPRQKKATPTGTSSTQPVQGADSGCCLPATSSAPEPAVSNKKQSKKRKRGPPLEISNAADIPTVSATLMSPFTAHMFDVFSSIARGSQPPSKPPSEPNQP